MLKVVTLDFLLCCPENVSLLFCPLSGKLSHFYHPWCLVCLCGGVYGLLGHRLLLAENYANGKHTIKQKQGVHLFLRSLAQSGSPALGWIASDRRFPRMSTVVPSAHSTTNHCVLTCCPITSACYSVDVGGCSVLRTDGAVNQPVYICQRIKTDHWECGMF